MRVAQEAMSKLFAYAEGGGTRSDVERGGSAARERKRKRRWRRWNDDGEVEERVSQWSLW